MTFLSSTGEPRRIAIYIRVSTAEQKIDGYSLEAQKKRLSAHVTNNAADGWVTKPAWLFCDVHTGSDLNRPQLTELRSAVREGKFDAVLVWKIDRLSRNLQHLLSIFHEMHAHNVSFISVQENIDFRGPIGNLIFSIFGAIAEFERELIRGRTRMGRLTSAELGNFTGSAVPYGYEPVPNPGGKGKKLAVIKCEQEWVEKIYEWYIYDNLGYGQIAAKLNELKVPRGAHTRARSAYVKWLKDHVESILTNPIYRGEYVANRHDEEGKPLPERDWCIVRVPACVSEMTWQQAQAARKAHTYNQAKQVYLLSGKLFDVGFNPSRAFVGCKRTKGGHSYRRKQFERPNGERFQAFEIPGKSIEDYVWGKVMEAMQDPEIFIRRYLSQEYTNPDKIADLTREIDSLRQEKENLLLAISRIEEAYERGLYDDEKLHEKTTEKQGEISRIEQKIQALTDEMAFISSVDVEVKKLRSASEQVKYRLEKLDERQKRILCDLFVDRIEVLRKPGVHGKRWDITATVFFRFNPAKFSEGDTEGRTQDIDKTARKTSSGGKNDVSGA